MWGSTCFPAAYEEHRAGYGHRMARRCCLVGVVWDAALTGICVLGLGFLLWWSVGLVLRPLPGSEARVLIPGRGDGARLEQLVRSLIWLRGLGLLYCPVVIADIDLTPAGRELALHLTARWPDVILWPVGQISEYLAKD